VTAIETVRAVRGTGRVSLACAVGGITVGRILDLDALSAAVGEVTWLITARHAASLAVAVGMAAFARSITGGPWRILATPAWVLLGLGLAIPFVDVGTVLPAADGPRFALYASSPLWLIHWTAYLTASMIAAVAILTTSVRNVAASRGGFRAQLLCLGTGTAFVVVYVALNAAHLLILVLNPVAETERLVDFEQGAANIASLLVGISLLAGLFEPFAVSLARRRHVWGLWPMWLALWDHAPHLEPELRRRGRLRSTLVPDARMVLLRLVVEIGDATRALAPRMVAHDPANPTERAAALRLALKQPELGATTTAGPPPPEEMTSIDRRAKDLYGVARAWNKEMPTAPAADPALAGSRH
jgi:hypothetical protein